MEGTRAIAVFCEDIREEKTAQDTLIGILPDNMAVSAFPSVAPKLGIYIRVHIDPKTPPKEFSVQFRMPWDEIAEVGNADSKLINEAVRQARDSKLPLAGIVLKAMISPFIMQRSGLATLVITIDGQESVCAMLNVKEGITPASSSTAPQPAS
ncbi:hypothetical protein ES707_11396 [subsurface metagenome]|jgi:hypothetical protein